MKISEVCTGSKIDQALRTLKSMRGSFIEVGHFEEQGEHGPSGMSYVELLSMWADGIEMQLREDSGTTLVIQDVRAQFVFNYLQSGKLTKDIKLQRAFKKFLANVSNPSSIDKLLIDFGEVLQREYKSTFNINTSPHMRGTDTPLFETGELKGVTAYRTSRDRTIKEG